MPYLSLRTIALAGFAMSLVLPCGDAYAGFALPAIGSGASSTNASSAVGGAHAGYNWQQGAAVFGFATDLQATQLSTASNAALIYPPGPGPIPPTDYAATWSTVDWFGTVRGQVGIANGPLLLYGTAGLAYGHSYLKTQYSTAGASLVAQATEVNVGWTAGAGFKYLVSPNLSFGLQYLYVDLGGIGLVASTPAPAITALAFSSSASNQFHTVTAGISWHFTPGGTAAPWQGGYAGLHGGGAWGNDTNASYTGSNPR